MPRALRTGGFPTRPYPLATRPYHNHPMHMVRHDHESIRRNMRIMNRQIVPNRLCFLTELVHFHLTPDYVTTQARLAVGTYRHKIRAFLRIIVPFQAKAMVLWNIRLIVHILLHGWFVCAGYMVRTGGLYGSVRAGLYGSYGRVGWFRTGGLYGSVRAGFITAPLDASSSPH